MLASFQLHGAAPGAGQDASAAASAQVLPAGHAKTADTGRLAPQQIRLLNRLTWGADEASARRLARIGPDAFIAEQLEPGPATLPSQVQAAIDAMQVSAVPIVDTVMSLQQQRAAVNAAPDEASRLELRRVMNERVLLLSREMRQRSLLRMIHSPRQLQEKMTWFWANHFHVEAENQSAILPLMVDYEENAIRPHALGKFRDLLAATVYHPAMLLYLDNYENREGRRNENYARELLELHTLGADGGHQQPDVEALSRVLTGLGVNLAGEPAELARGMEASYVRRGVFEFNPSRHDNDAKRLLGHDIAGDGLAEVDKVIDMLASHPSTARHISRKLAVYFVSDDPPDDLISRLSQVFQDSGGDVRATLAALFADEAFEQSLEADSFKDPMQHVLGAMRLIYGSGDPIVNAQPVANWLSAMGQGLYKRATPEGYPIERQAWQNSRQLLVRFDVARTMAGTAPELFHPFHESGEPPKRAAPDFARPLYDGLLHNALAAATRKALERADSPHEWNMLLLASPDFNSR
nr:DUF1800 domain-containing protein [Pseudomonas sp.]